MEIIPVNFGLKYKPPKLGIQYFIQGQPTTFVHEIALSFVTRSSNVDQVCRDLVDKNKMYLNPKVVGYPQIRRLVERLVKQIGGEDKENINNNKQ